MAGSDHLLDVRRLAPDDWLVYRRLRLAALADSPGAFASSLEREEEFDERSWRDRLGGHSQTLAAFSDAGPIGIIGLLVTADTAPHSAHIVSMWVDPAHRGRGVGHQLVAAAIDAAMVSGRPDVTLWVVKDNQPARRLYERHGFVATGQTQPLPSNPSLREIEMTRRP